MTYADIFSAVEADFAAALAKLGHDGMWFASFGEVWVGYEAYDATQWHSRTPPESPLTAATTESVSDQQSTQQSAGLTYESVAMRQDGDGYLYAPTSGTQASGTAKLGSPWTTSHTRSVISPEMASL